MSSAPTTTKGDDRVQARSSLAGLLSTPEVGALIGAVAVMVLFLAVAPTFRSMAAIGTIGYQASTIGMMAVPVALLMIGGEFDLSAGVSMTTSALVASMFSWQFGTNLWVGVLVALLVALAVGFLNGWLLVRTKLPSFLVTLGTFFILQVRGGISAATMGLDRLVFPRYKDEPLDRPIFIIGNPRSGTTFLHRFLLSNGGLSAFELWEMLFPAITARKLLGRIVPKRYSVVTPRIDMIASTATPNWLTPSRKSSVRVSVSPGLP